jgi:NAD-dependent dihydropyrimidine dehydrogenase PreA subunit
MFHIDAEKCNSCGVCVPVCPQEAISIIGEKAVINHRLCGECGNCLEVCVAGAIYEAIKEPQFVRVQRAPKFSTQGKEVRTMPFGRGWFGRGSPGIGRGMGLGRGFGMGRGMGYGRGFGIGRGNPYPYCRFYPWLPRRWWAYGGGYTPAQPPPYFYNPGSNYGYQAPYAWW